MEDETKMLFEIKASLARLEQSSVDSLRRLNSLEEHTRSSIKERSVYVTALLTLFINVINCFKGLVPVLRG